LQAYAKVGPKLGIYLVIAGEHRWLCEEELEMLNKLGIAEWVIRPGWIDHKVLSYFYNLAEALLLPSLYEACPSPILEAMVTGCPVVTSNRFGTQELADNAAILVDPESVESIAKGMKKVVLDKAVHAQLIENGYERAKQFSWKKCAEETLDVLEKAYTAPKIKRRSIKAIKSDSLLSIKRPDKFN
jgi:O-antigen biosynthesis alpha-1,2-mannosyltransferase